MREREKPARNKGESEGVTETRTCTVKVSQRTLRKWLILQRLAQMKALCACKTDERTVNGNMRAAESLPRIVEDEKSSENMDREGDD